jgi:hypothetical protein
MTAFPGAEATFTGFTAGHTLAADSHAAQHNLEQTEIVATQHKIGTGLSTPTSGMLLRGTGAGTSAWGQVVLTTDVTGVLPVANGGLGQTNFNNLTLGNPTLTTPTIASFINATHDHTNAAGGGQLGTNALQDGAVTQSKRGAVSAVGTITTTASTPGNITVTGLSFQPAVVLFMMNDSDHVSASVQNFGLGWSDGVTSGSTSLRGQEAGDFSGKTSSVFAGATGSTGAGQADTLTLSSLNSDGFTVAVTNNSSVNCTYLYLAIG